MNDVRQRALNVLQFLRAMQEMRTRPVRDVASYPDVLWLSDVRADHPKTACAWNSELEEKEGLWLSLARVDRTPPPTLPPVLGPWVPHGDVQDSTLHQPHLHDEAELEIDTVDAYGGRHVEFQIEQLRNHPEVANAFQAWLPGWQSWTEADRQTAPLRAPYQHLYSMYQAQRAEPERLELVLGLGLLSTSPERQKIRRHLMTARAAVNLDLDNGQLDVRLDPEQSQINLEQDMLATADRVPSEASDRIAAMLGDLPKLFGEDGIEPMLREWTNAFSSDAVYLPDLAPDSPHGTVVGFAPALILRPRGRQSFLQSIQTIEESLAASAEIPLPMQLLLADPDDQHDERASSGEPAFGGLGTGRSSTGNGVPDDSTNDEETYFIKPANPQQLEVAQKLREHPIVVVQGPPGTGKTHTITNLMTDLLAHGKRVLVTSHSSQALKVIKGMLPDEVRDLCVSLTDTSVKGQQDLRQSVNTVIGETTGRTIAELDDEHRRLQRDLTQARELKERALAGLRSIREQETKPADSTEGHYRGTPQQIAQQLSADEHRYSWIGAVDFSAPRVTRNEFGELLALFDTVTDDVVADARLVPATDDLISPDELRRALDDHARITERLGAPDETEREMQDALSQAQPHTRDQLERVVVALNADMQPILASGHHWITHAFGDLWNGRHVLLGQLFADSRNAVEAVQRDLAAVGQSHVTGLEKLDIASAAGKLHSLASHFSSGGGLRKLGRTPGPVREAESEIGAIRVDGRQIATVQDATVASAACSAELRLLGAERLWNERLNGSLGMRAAQLAEMTHTLKRVIDLKESLDALRGLTARIGALSTMSWSDPAFVQRLASVIERQVTARRLAEIDAAIESAATTVSNMMGRRDIHSAVAATHSALVSRDPNAYLDAWSSISRAEEANLQVDRLKSLHRKVKASLPDVAALLKGGTVPAELAATAKDIDHAYAWAERAEWLQVIIDPSDETQLRDDLEKARTSESRALRHIAANRAWRYCQSRMTRAEQQQLKVYAQATNKIGRGTGKTAPRYRAQAREALQKAQSAVPGWIMSLQSVVDSVPFHRPGAFDIVIVDEASQSGHEALLLTWLAKQVLVVGDGEQISPDNVGIDVDGVFHLQNELLADLPLKSIYGPSSSFLEHAEAIAPSPIMLREHFRCMPEIIEFSNRLSYDGKLLPVRQHGLARLDPLRVTYISDAIVRGTTGRLINAAEAEQIVGTIDKCCSEPAYDDKTMGVITLLGTAQHKYIGQLLLDRLGTEEVEKRRLLCSGPAAFQGDERDVIFMSLVASPHGEDGPRRIGALVRREHQQRINVAASRARDQVWVFHSVTKDELPSGDLRRQYLEYLADEDATTTSAAHDGAFDEHAFGSSLEQGIYTTLATRGYHVRPHAKAAGHHIDLVVVGAQQQLAIECDGDEFDASDSGNQDLRQGDLERLGWEFWRIRGSQYFRNPESALEPLWHRLDELEIQPRDENAVSSGTVVEIVAAPPVNVEEPVESEALVIVPEVSPAPTPEPSVRETAPGPAGLLIGKQSYARLQLEAEAIIERLDRDTSAETARQKHAKVLALRGRIEQLQERSAWLRRILNEAVVVDEHHFPSEVWPGAIVKLRDNDSDTLIECYVASVDLGDDSLDRFGPDSPLGLAIAGARVGQRVTFMKGNGQPAIYDIVAVTD